MINNYFPPKRPVLETKSSIVLGITRQFQNLLTSLSLVKTELILSLESREQVLVTGFPVSAFGLLWVTYWRTFPFPLNFQRTCGENLPGYHLAMSFLTTAEVAQPDSSIYNIPKWLSWGSWFTTVIMLYPSLYRCRHHNLGFLSSPCIMFTVILQSLNHGFLSHKRTVRLRVPERGHCREKQPKPCSELSNFTAVKGFPGLIYIALEKYGTIPSGQIVRGNKALSSIQRQWLLLPALPRKHSFPHTENDSG